MAEEIKACATCKHLIGVRHREELHAEWKCGRKEAVSGINYVTGKKIHFFCVQMRQGHAPIPICGIEGSWWEEYQEPQKSLAVDIEPVKAPTEAPREIRTSRGKFSLDL